MKTQFNSLVELARELEELDHRKEDYIVSSDKMAMIDPGLLGIDDTGAYLLNNVSHGQIASKLEIPKKYYDKIGGIMGLRETNVNELLEASDKSFMLRTRDGQMRAVLSDRYRPFDNVQVMKAFLPALQQFDTVQVKTSNLSETRMYMQIVFPSLSAEIAEGDVVHHAITLTNSEVGFGATDIKSGVWRLRCKNGMIGESVIRKYHVGARLGAQAEDYSIYADDTIEASIEAVKLKIRDALKSAVTDIAFQKTVDALRSAAGDVVKKPESLVKNVTKHFSLADSMGELILSNMVEEKNFTRWGLANGITALAHQIDNPDQQFEMERLGNDVITLKPDQWESLTA